MIVRKILKYVLILAVAVFAACTGKTAADPLSQKVDSLLALMTFEEKIGQMNQLEGWMNADKEAQIRAGQVGSLLNVADPKEVNRLQRIAMEESRLGIPLLFCRDVIHGFKTILPIPIGQAATWNPQLVEQGARMTAEETVQTGIRLTFSPMVDIARDARWGRLAEGYGEDTYLTEVMGAATVRGYQFSCANNPINNSDQIVNGLAACAKHFAGYGASESGRDYNTTWIPEILLRDVYLPPFKACAEAGAMTMMCSFNALNGLPSSANQHLNIDILRNEWNYDGVLISDWGSGSDLIPHGLCADKQEAAIRCYQAQMEIDMEGHLYEKYAQQLLDKGAIDRKRIDDMVRNILRLKFRLGLFNQPYATTETPEYYSQKALDTALKTAQESAVLLKNNGILPLVNNDNKVNILICGPLADAKKEQLGTWIFDGEPEHSVTPLMAFKQDSRFSVAYEPGLTYSRDTSGEGIERAVKAAKNVDAILYFCGEEAILSGEARCRADINLPGAQCRMMEELAKTGKPAVMIVMAGRPLTIGNEVEKAAAVLYAYHGGTMAGPALLSVIAGDVVPSGHLPMTMPQMVGQVPMYYNRLNTGRPATTPMLINDIPIGCPQFSIGQSSYHLEVGDQPLFHFGYGLSYTTFEYGEVDIVESVGKNHDSGTERQEFSVKCSITNTGKYDAMEVPQLYVHQMSGELARPVKELKGFRKIMIKSGESVTVEFKLTPDDLAYWHEKWKGKTAEYYRTTDPADYEVWVAPDSRCLTRSKKITIH